MEAPPANKYLLRARHEGIASRSRAAVPTSQPFRVRLVDIRNGICQFGCTDLAHGRYLAINAMRRGSGIDRMNTAEACNALVRRCGIPPVVLVCAVALFATPTSADAADEDFGAWFAVFANGKLPEPLNDSQGSWRLWLDAALRFGDDASRFSQGLIRAGLGYPLGNAWTVWAGYAYIRTEPPYANPPTDEQRIWEQVIWNGAINRLKLSSRTRLEQRFFRGGTDTGWRLRESIKLTHPLDSSDSWSLVLSD